MSAGDLASEDLSRRLGTEERDDLEFKANGDDRSLLRKARRRAADLPFDQRPVLGSAITDLDLELFRSTYLTAAVSADVLAENDRPTEQHLSSLRLVEPDAHVPTALGLLAIGFDPSAWISGAYVQFVRYEGDELSSTVLDDEEVRGNVLGQLDTLSRLLPANIRTAVRDVGGLRQADAPDYSLPALRELILGRDDAPNLRNVERASPHRVVRRPGRGDEPGGPFGAVTNSKSRTPTGGLRYGGRRDDHHRALRQQGRRRQDDARLPPRPHGGPPGLAGPRRRP